MLTPAAELDNPQQTQTGVSDVSSYYIVCLGLACELAKLRLDIAPAPSLP